MSNDTRTRTGEGIPTWESLEVFVRGKVQAFIQQLLEEEVAELLGRARSERRAAVDAPAGYRNGHGKPRRLAMQGGTVTLRRPRLRGLEARFRSKVLPLFRRRTKELGELLPELYLHGLSLGDFELALRGLLGDGAPLSPASIARLKAAWQIEYDAWKTRDLSDRELVYVWADGVYVKAGLEKERACLLVVIGAFRSSTASRSRDRRRGRPPDAVYTLLDGSSRSEDRSVRQAELQYLDSACLRPVDALYEQRRDPLRSPVCDLFDDLVTALCRSVTCQC